MLLTKIFPFIDWIKGYNLKSFQADALAGLTVALVLIPQSMAYAQLAGLPAYFGLYAAFLPPMVAALFGSSRQLATGPVAVVSLMSAASLQPLATAGSTDFIAYSIILALIVGIFQLSLGVLRLGLVVNFLSHPVVNGFTNAAAIIIASSQFSKFFGVYVDKAEHHYDTMIRVAQAAFDYTHWPTLLYGIGAVAIMVFLKRVNPKIPAVLCAVVVTTLLSYFTGFNNDMRVGVNAIQEQTLPTMVEEFNHEVAAIAEFGAQRAELGKELEAMLKEESHGHGPSLEAIQKKSAVEILTAKMKQAQAHSADIRQTLRLMKFEKAMDGDQAVFLPKESIPEGVTTDGGTWRIKVGNTALKADNLLLMGGGAIVGKIPEGLPTFTIPQLDGSIALKLFPTAIIISLLGFMEAIAIAKAMAAKTGQKLDPNQELIGQGLANILGSFSSSYAISGSFSRSAVNLQAGAVTGISSVITSIMVVITLLFLTPLLYHLPQAVLAAVIMMAVIGLVNTKGFVHAWKAQKHDGIISVISFLVTLAYAPHLDKGIMVGVALSMGVFLYKSMRPVVAKLSMYKDGSLQSAEHHRLRGCRHIAVVRFDGALFFANASYLDEQIIKFRSEMPDLRYVLLDASGINDIDASGEEELALLVDRLHAANYGFGVCNAKGPILDVLDRTHLFDKIGRENFYADTKSAVADIVSTIHEQPDLPSEGCKSCPLTKYLPVES
nr:SulP family inorganic anion transporter [uncultured Desulfobulbus sp.]